MSGQSHQSAATNHPCIHNTHTWATTTHALPNVDNEQVCPNKFQVFEVGSVLHIMHTFEQVASMEQSM